MERISSFPLQTPPKPTGSAPKIPSQSQFIEYILQFPILIEDQSPWPMLHLNAEGCIANLAKPVTKSSKLTDVSPLSINLPDAYLTRFGVLVHFQEGTPDFHPNAFANLLFRVAAWIRVTCRQFWILSGAHGFAARFHATSNRQLDRGLEQEYSSVWSGGLVLKPLTLDIWSELETLLNKFDQPPVSDSVFCDALNHFSSGNVLQCIVQLAIAAEIEVSNLFDEVATTSQDLRAKETYFEKKKTRRDYFQWKLKNASLLFGLSDPTHWLGYSGSDWCETALDLYRLRNSAVHSGVLNLGTKPLKGTLDNSTFSKLARFILTIEDLYQWADEQRTILNIPLRRKAWRAAQERPIESINNATMEAASGDHFFPSP